MDEGKTRQTIKSEEAALILRAVLTLGRRLRAERPAGSASLSAIAILSTLRRLGAMPAVRLAAEEQLQPQSLTRIIAALERDGLIARTPGKTDARELIIAPTESGLQALAADMGARRQWLEQALSATLTEAERAIVLAASEAMLRLASYDERRADEDHSPG
jgi:DNA-binding MarR family transcriptional regulator